MNKYSVMFFWSETDNAFSAGLPELKGYTGHEETQDEALREVNAAAVEWLQMATEKGRAVPQPKGRLLFA